MDGSPKPDLTAVELLVCTTCKFSGGVDLGDVRPGAALHAALEGADMPDGITVRGVECLSNCNSGCSVVLRGGDARWSYVYGNLEPAMADLVLEGATKYLATSDGLVPWRERSQHFRKNCIARIPPLEPATDE